MVVSSSMDSRITSREGLEGEYRREEKECQRGLDAVVGEGESAAVMIQGFLIFPYPITPPTPSAASVSLPQRSPQAQTVIIQVDLLTLGRGILDHNTFFIPKQILDEAHLATVRAAVWHGD